MAIEGDMAFFQIQLPDTRQLIQEMDNLQGIMKEMSSNADGYRLIPEMTVPEGATNISIAKDGTVSVNVHGDEETQIGQIELVQFINPAGLHSMGDNLYLETGASGAQ